LTDLVKDGKEKKKKKTLLTLSLCLFCLCSMSTKPILLKVVLIGESGVGKTSLLWSLCNRKLKDGESMQPTIGVDFLTHKTSVKLSNGNSREATMQIWDTSGQERFRSIASPFYRGADAVVFVFDVTNRASFEALSFWIGKLREFFADGGLPNALLVGNKVDCAADLRAVTRDEAQKFAQANELVRYMETAASARDTVEAAFDALADAIRTNDRHSPFEPTPVMMLSAYNGRLRVKQEPASSKSCCSARS
jgi:small GTP-binding protein